LGIFHHRNGEDTTQWKVSLSKTAIEKGFEDTFTTSLERWSTVNSIAGYEFAINYFTRSSRFKNCAVFMTWIVNVPNAKKAIMEKAMNKVLFNGYARI
jgi:hypothetical protein